MKNLEDPRTCTLCGLAQTRTQVVLGAGDAQASVMFVGEAPGKQEDRTGRGFQGSAGVVFDEILGFLGLARDQIWLNNAVRCRPTHMGTKNRPPRNQEIDACRVWLLDDLRRVRPSVVVTLGRIPFRSVTGRDDFQGVRGRPLILEDETGVFPLYHPAYLIYRRDLIGDYAQDLWALRKYLEERQVLLGPVRGGRFVARPGTAG